MRNKAVKLIISVSAICLSFLSRADAVMVNALARNVIDNVQVSTMTFDMAYSSDSYKLSNQYIQLYYETYTGVPWNVSIYTKNLAIAYPDPLNRAGLVGVATNTISVPLAWQKSNSLLGSPAVDIPNGNVWNLFNNKDTESSNLPPSSTVLSSALGNSAPATYYIYLEGNFYGASAADYGTIVWVDLYQTIDSVPPVIADLTQTNGGKIVSMGNDLVLNTNVTDETNVADCVLWYKLDNGNWSNKYDGVATSIVSTKNKSYQFTLSAETISSHSQISYCFVATDGYNFTVLNGNGLNSDQSLMPSMQSAVALGEATPQVITFVTEVQFPPITSGSLVLSNGNSNYGNTSLTIPQGALSSPATITISQLDSNSSSNARQGPAYHAGNTPDIMDNKPVAIYDFSPEALHFNSQVSISLLFLADSKDVIRFPDGKVFPGVKKSDLKVYWWDGFDWRILGGRLDEKLNTLTVRADSLGKYAIFFTPPPNASDYRPLEKIITPNGDDKNPYASFGNLNGQDYSIDIFDIRGHKVKTITTSSLPRWDGTDDGGRVVESGVYLYQFKADVNGSSKLISGTIVVAK